MTVVGLACCFGFQLQPWDEHEEFPKLEVCRNIGLYGVI